MGKSLQARKTAIRRSVLEARDGQVTARFLIVANRDGVHIPPDLRERVYAAEERFRKKTTPQWGAHIKRADRQPFPDLFAERLAGEKARKTGHKPAAMKVHKRTAPS